MIITIDGPAGSGKSTVAEIIAEKLGFVHFNSGMLYRAITAFLLENGYNISSINENSIIPQFSLTTKFVKSVQHAYVNGVDYTNQVRDNAVSCNVSVVSTNKYVRQMVNTCQREFCKKNNSVYEGRDTGSAVFPNAEFKFYLDCSIEERAKRRFKEEQAKGTKLTLSSVKKQIQERDKIDKNRKIAPLTIPKNAIIVDSSNKTIDEVVEEIVKLIKI